jgi:hypothetical protein
MRYPVFFVLLFAIALSRGAMASDRSIPSPSMMPANDPAIVYEGRFDVTSTGAVRWGFPGVSAHLHFRGDSIAVRIDASDDDVCFDVSVDAATPVLLRTTRGAGDYSLFQSDRTGEHMLTLTRRNESWQGTCTLAGFSVDGKGELMSAPELPKRRMMFIGDSVTCGEMTTYDNSREMRSKLNCNARVSYGMILARRLGAQCHLVSYGGRGIIRDWQGIRDTRNAPLFYELALPDDPSVRWDHRRYVPDAVGIQLGTNDFNQGIPDQNEFINAYVQFVEKVRRDAPQALIFLMDSPIVNDEPGRGPRRSVLHSYLEQIVSRLGSSKVILAPLPRYPGVPNNGHPTGAEHETMADELEPLLRRALGW